MGNSSIDEVQMLQNALQYLATVIQWRLTSYFDAETISSTGAESFSAVMPTPPNNWLVTGTAIARFITTHRLNISEQLTLIMALAPHLQPDFFDRTITAKLPTAGDYPQIGGSRGKNHRGFLPTGDTVLFILGGDELRDRICFHKIFSPEHLFAQQNILSLQSEATGEPLMSARLVLSFDYINLFMHGAVSPPRFSTHFPAQRITTSLEWDDLVINPQTHQRIQELQTWINHSPTLLNDWGMKHKLKLGYRALFYGPPGTGKTLTASLLGKYTEKQVYKIDISMIVSKFIGETEKNLANLFTQAESKGWILFFDEADALFGKRTNVQDSHDKYANQEVSYLLQRIENYDGLVILASNLKNNIDDAFIRRFQSIIYFPLPGIQERLILWQRSFPEQAALAENINLSEVAERYELTGADIMNVVQYCCLQALAREDNVIQQQDLHQAIRREFHKVGKTLI